MQQVGRGLVRGAVVRHWHRCAGCWTGREAAQPSQLRSPLHQQANGSHGWRWRAWRACLGTGAAGSAAAVLFNLSAPAHCLETETPRRPPKENLENCVKELENLGLEDRLSVAMENREQHAQDYSFHPTALPDIVAWPESTDEVSRILRICNHFKVPVIPYGAGTSLEGHVLAVHGGLAMDLNLMDQVIEVNPADMTVKVQCGITYVDLNESLEEHGLFFPPDPGAPASIGGMIGTNAGGSNALLHGSVRDNVVNVTAVLPSGEAVKTRQTSRKSSAGYDLTHLFTGAEGTLGVVTEATLKLKQIPAASAVALCTFESIEDATRVVAATMKADVPMARMELLDELMVKGTVIGSGLDLEEKPLLMMEFAGTSEEAVAADISKVKSFAEANGGGEFKFATESEERDDLWRARKQCFWNTYALRPDSEIWTTDVCVPVSRLCEMIRETKQDLETTSLVAPLVAHAGDGNFHLLILVRPSDAKELAEAREFNARMVRRAIAKGGTCSGEHGIGEGKVEFLEEEHGKAAVDVMRAIKAALDPNNIMNPGKIFRL